MLLAVMWFAQEAKLIHQQFSNTIVAMNQVPTVHQLQYVRTHMSNVPPVQRVDRVVVDTGVLAESESKKQQQSVRTAGSVSEPELQQAENVNSTARATDRAPLAEGGVSGLAAVSDPNESLAHAESLHDMSETNNAAHEMRDEPVKAKKVSDSTVDQVAYLSEVAQAIHQQTNTARIDAGQTPLVYNESLATVGQRHSSDMQQQDFFAHTDPDGCDVTCRLKQDNFQASAWGENIAWRNDTQQVDAVVLATWFVSSWMESPGHRENILSDLFTHEGIGLSVENGVVYATVVFATPR